MSEAADPRSLSERVRRFSKHLASGGPWTLHEHTELLDAVYRELTEVEELRDALGDIRVAAERARVLRLIVADSIISPRGGLDIRRHEKVYEFIRELRDAIESGREEL